MTKLRTLRHRTKRWLPPFLQRNLRAVENAVQLRLYQPSHLKLWFHDYWEQPNVSDMSERVTPRLCRGTRSEESRRVYQQTLLNWLRRAQDIAPEGGVAGYYALAEGWSAAYPETTGYIIVTILEAANRLRDRDLAIRARRMADWELAVQLSEGAWQSGFVTAPRVPAVFNTGQVIQGLLAAYSVFKETNYLDAAVRGGHWLVDHQDDDGAWRRHVYNDFPNSYSTRVAWPLLALAQATGEPTFRRAAIRYLEWASRRQLDNGWLELCTLELGEAALTHTLAYAIEGFIESGILLGDEQWVAIGKRTAEALLYRYEVRHHLAGAYDRQWCGDHSFSCLTGCAQMSRVWGRLFELTNDARYLNSALKLNDFVLASVDLRSSNPGIQGGVKGSQPLWGAYMTWRLPSWAVKFTLDALFQEQDALTRLKEDGSEHHYSLWSSL